MERRGEGDVVPTSLMMDPFDRAGYTSKMLRDQHQRTISTEKTGWGISFGLKNVVDLKNAEIENILNRLFLPADWVDFTRDK